MVVRLSALVQEVPTDALGVTPPHVWVALPPGREVFSAPDAQSLSPESLASRNTASARAAAAEPVPWT